MGAARPPSSAVGPPAAAAGRSTGVPDRLFGLCERLLRRPPPRGHAPAAAARLDNAAPSAPARRAARAAASSRRRAGRGAGSARPSPGAHRAQSVCTSRPGAPRTGSPFRSDAGRVAPRRVARDGARRASATSRRWWWRAPCGALCAGRGWRSGAVRNAARRVPRVAVCGLLDLPARGRAGLDKGPTVRARWRPRSEAAAVEVAQQTRPGSRHRHRGDIVHAVWAHRWSVVLEVYWNWYWQQCALLRAANGLKVQDEVVCVFGVGVCFQFQC